MAKNEHRYYVPYEMTRQEAAQNGIDPKEVRRVRIGARDTQGILIEMSKEVHDEYVRFIYAEEQRSYRARKCIVKSPKTGKLARCEGKCSECTKKPDGAALSLDKLREDGSIEAMAADESVLTNVLVDSLASMLQAKNPLLAEVFRRVYDHQTQQEIADELGLSKRQVQTLVATYRRILQRQVTREDIMARENYSMFSGKKHD